MNQAAQKWLAVGWAAMLLCSVFSMTAVFIGSVSQYLAASLTTQLYALPLAVLATLINVHRIRQARGTNKVFRQLWRDTPGWMVFVVASASGLTLIAELALVLVALHADSARPWIEHVPAIGSMVFAVALATAVARTRAWQAAESRNTLAG